MASSTFSNDQERLQGLINTYKTKKADTFPEIDDISAKDAVTEAPQSVLFVDARSEEERAVSMIPSAVTKEEFMENGGSLAAGKGMVLTYCALGARGGKLAKEIKLAHPHLVVKNLEGATLAWAHAGGLLVDAHGEPTKKFHSGGPNQLQFAPRENGYEAES